MLKINEPRDRRIESKGVWEPGEMSTSPSMPWFPAGIGPGAGGDEDSRAHTSARQLDLSCLDSSHGRDPPQGGYSVSDRAYTNLETSDTLRVIASHFGQGQITASGEVILQNFPCLTKSSS